MNTDQVKATLRTIGHGGLVLLCAAAMISVIVPEARTAIRSKLIKDYRMIVSTAQGQLSGNGELYTVAKVKTRDALFLEVYAPAVDGFAKMIEKIQLNDRRDGFFSFNGQATNLAIDDIDGDGRPEILAPSFDNDLVGHLQVFNYNPSSKGFERRIN